MKAGGIGIAFMSASGIIWKVTHTGDVKIDKSFKDPLGGAKTPFSTCCIITRGSE